MENHMHQARERPAQGGNLGSNRTLVPAPAPASAGMMASGDDTYDGGCLSLLGGLFISHPVEETKQKTQTKALFDTIEDVGTEPDLMDPMVCLDGFFFLADL
jgi:hypothetical protein